MAGYNRTRSVEQLLEKAESLPPSFTVHLHSEYWILNNGSKFLYHNQIASLLDDIRAHRIPVDFLELFESARVPFYEGCMIVELLDYRPQRSQEPALKTPHKTRVVLHPNPETLWGDLCSLNQQRGGKWTDMDALEVEAKLILATAPPLCLDPDPHLSRIVNHVLRVSTPSMPLSLKRKATAMEPEEDGPEKAKRERLLTFMSPRDNRSHAPSYRMLDALLASKKKAASEAGPMIMPGNQYMNLPPQPPQIPHSHPQPPAAPPTPAPTLPQSHSPTEATDNKGQHLKKANTPQMPPFSVAFVRSNGSHTPVPPQPTHQFVNQHPPPQPATTPNMQPQVYSSIQASTEAAKRAATPSLQHTQLQQQQYLQYHHQQQQLQQQQQQQSHHQQPQPQQPLVQQQRPPSQPQHPLAQQHPQQPTAQQVQQAQQRFTQSPKPPPQTNVVSPVRTQPTPQPYPGTPSQFQPPIPSTHFLQQPPPGSRVAPKPQVANGAQQQQQPSPSQPTHPSNASPAQMQQVQYLYSQQIQQSQQQLQQQQAHSMMQQQQQRMNIAVANAQKNGGRATPQIPIQQNPGQQQQQPQSAAATPSPVRGSPIVTHQQLAAAAAARSSPMPTKAQIPQPGQGQQQVPQQHPLASQNMGMQPPRVTFTPQYNPRPPVNGNPQQGHMMMVNGGQSAVNGTPKLTAASPRMVGRPMTPAAIGVDGKPQQQQMQPQQPIRRQTPLQQVQQLQVQQQQQQALSAASPQPQHPTLAQVQAQVQMQASQIQAQQQAQQQAAQQQQTAQGQQPPPQTQTPAQQPAQIPQQMAQYPQVYGYPQYQMTNAYWRAMSGNTPQQQQQQQQQHIQQLLQHQQRLAQQQQQQQQGVSGGQAMMVNGQPQQQQQAQQGGMTPQQSQAALIAASQQRALAMQIQAGQQGGGPGQLAQAAMMGKMHTQTQAQMQAHAQAQVQATGKGKAGPKKGATAKKGPQR